MNDELNGLKSTATGVAAASVAAAATDLHTLINTLCPDGVEWKTVGELQKSGVIYTLTPSLKLKKDVYQERGDTPIVSQDKELITGYCNTVDPKIPDGEYVCFGDHTERIKYLGTRFVQGADGLKIMSTNEATLLPKYYYYAIMSNYVCIGKYERHFKRLLETKIPVPPLAVQVKIVQILDKFTELANELAEKLAKEQQARRTQYEYYRDWLLDLAHPEGKQGKVWDLLRTLCPNGVEWKTLGDIASISRGGSLQRKDFRPSGVPCIHYGQIYTSYNNLTTDHTISFIDEACAARQRFANKNDLIMTVTSENVRDVCKCIVWLGQERVAVSAHTVIIQHDQNSKYLAYYFSSVWFFMQKRSLAYGTKVIDVSLNALSKVRIPIPPLPVQAEIVRILDQFSTLAEDITAGLPAEIAARQAQYEYYRNQLLSFKDVSDRAPGC